MARAVVLGCRGVRGAFWGWRCEKRGARCGAVCAPATRTLSLADVLSCLALCCSNEQEDLYSYVTVADTPNGFSGLGTKVVDDM